VTKPRLGAKRQAAPRGLDKPPQDGKGRSAPLPRTAIDSKESARNG